MFLRKKSPIKGLLLLVAVLLLIGLPLLASGCDTGTTDDGNVIVSIQVSPTDFTIGLGATQQMTCTATASDNGTSDVTNEVHWYTEDGSIATISETGLVTGIAEGSTTVIAYFAVTSLYSTTNVTVAPFGSVQGTVTDAISGLPVSGATVAIGTASTTTATNGTYSLTNLLAGDHTITATMTGYNNFTGTVTVVSGAVTTYDFTMTQVGPQITLITPDNGVPRDQVVIDGGNFGATQGTSTVTFNGAPAWVLSWSDTQITVIVPTTGTGNVVVTVNGSASNGVPFTVNPANFLAVCLRGLGEIAVIDLSDMSVVNYPVGTGPQSIAVSPDRQFFYVTDNVGSESGTMLHVVQVSDGTVVDSIDLGASPWGVAVNPDGTRVYVSVQGNDEIAVIDTATNTVINTITVGDKPTGIAISPDGSTLCVPNHGDDTASFIDTATELVVHTSPVFGTSGGEPWEFCVLPNGTQSYCSDGDEGDTVFAFDMADPLFPMTGILITPNDGDHDPIAMAASPDGTMVCVGIHDSPVMVIIDPLTNAQAATINTPSITANDYPRRIAVDFDSTRAFYASSDDDLIVIVDLINEVEGATINFGLGDRPNGMVVY